MDEKGVSERKSERKDRKGPQTTTNHNLQFWICDVVCFPFLSLLPLAYLQPENQTLIRTFGFMIEDMLGSSDQTINPKPKDNRRSHYLLSLVFGEVIVWPSFPLFSFSFSFGPLLVVFSQNRMKKLKRE